MMKLTLMIQLLLVAAIAGTPCLSLAQDAGLDNQQTESPSDQGRREQTIRGTADEASNSGLDPFADEESLIPYGGDSDLRYTSGCQCGNCTKQPWYSRVFGGVEYLNWWNKGSRLPPLVAEGVTGVGVQNPGTRVLFGGNFIGGEYEAGLRVTGGLWLDDCQSRAVVVRGFGSAGSHTSFSKNTPTAGFPLYGIPFYNTFPPASEDGFRVARPGIAGTVTVQAATDVFGVDATYKALLDEGCNYRFDLLAGYQFSKIDDDLVLSTVSAFPFATHDLFDVSNEFNGATIGLSGDFNQGCVTFQLMGKLGMGNMRQSVAITGNNTLAGGARPLRVAFSLSRPMVVHPLTSVSTNATCLRSRPKQVPR